MPYTSRDEITTAVHKAIQARLDGADDTYAISLHDYIHSPTLLHREITEDDIEAHLMTSIAGSPPLDILVRSSGVKRLSDYMLWQVWHTVSATVGVVLTTAI